MYTLSLFPEEKNASGAETNRQVQQDLVSFVLEFQLENAFIYRYVGLGGLLLAV